MTNQYERRPINAYHLRAIETLDAPGGRFAAVVETTVTGTTPITKYPRAAGIWSDPVQVPPEPPLGYSVDDLDPGEPEPEQQEKP